jgi:hypothetical protein
MHFGYMDYNTQLLLVCVVIKCTDRLGVLLQARS